MITKLAMQQIDKAALAGTSVHSPNESSPKTLLTATAQHAEEFAMHKLYGRSRSCVRVISNLMFIFEYQDFEGYRN